MVAGNTEKVVAWVTSKSADPCLQVVVEDQCDWASWEAGHIRDTPQGSIGKAISRIARASGAPEMREVRWDEVRWDEVAARAVAAYGGARCDA